MSTEKTFEVGAAVVVSSLQTQYPAWTLHVKPGNRKPGATGKVTGFFRLDQDLICVSQDDGSSAVYEANEVS